jgi:hypothetical protein
LDNHTDFVLLAKVQILAEKAKSLPTTQAGKVLVRQKNALHFAS